MARCDELARYSARPDALERTYLSPESKAAGALVLRWMEQAGMRSGWDSVGNVVGRYDGLDSTLPALLLGSHLDTVRDAGKYDGMLGVLCAIECVHALNAGSRRLPFPIEVIGFADEEGVRFGATYIGSRAVAGTLGLDALALRDERGETLEQALHTFGLDPANFRAAQHRPEDVAAYIEMHIEQGPLLETEGLPVGVVCSINGATRLRVEIDGTAGHAGTVPMQLRRDALAAAAECIVAIEAYCGRSQELVGTVGSIEAKPGAANVIPSRTTFTVDLRCAADDLRMHALQDLIAAMQRICARRKVEFRARTMHESAATACAPWLVEQLGAAIAEQKIPVRTLTSGAGHDGVAMSALCAIGMLFVRCVGGVSHSPSEAVAIEDVEVATRSLLQFVESFRCDRPRE